MDPIRPINRKDTSITAITRVADGRVRRETPEEAHERRQRDQREQARREAARAWADAQLRAVEAHHEPTVLPDDESDDGLPHVDIRI
jgi:hypothetical protein